MNRKDYISDNLINLGSRLRNPSAPGVMSNPSGVMREPVTAEPDVSVRTNQGKSVENTDISEVTASAFEQRARDIRRSRQDLAMRMNCELAAVEKQLSDTESLSAYADFIRARIKELDALEDDGSQTYFMKLERLRIAYFVELTKRGRAENSGGGNVSTAPASSLSDLLRFTPRDRFRLMVQLTLPLTLAVVAGAVIIALAVIIAF